jgi:hypothetical protein
MKKILAILLTIFLTACAVELARIYDEPGMPGYVSSEKSEFDGTERVKLAPAYIEDGIMLRLGLLWTSDFPKNSYALIAEWPDAINFEPESPLKINIEGKIKSFEPIDIDQYGNTRTITPFGTYGNITTKVFLINRSDIEDIADSKRAVVRVEFLESYWEGTVQPSAKAMETYNSYPNIWAVDAFSNFLSEVENN